MSKGHNTLYPLHRTAMMKTNNIRPYGMLRMKMEPEQRESLENIALGIFTDMVNAGRGFQEALAAIYLSGLVHATELSKGTK